MTEASYVAWDDNLYEWPPPDGWYESSDGKWWPEGYGPGQGESPSPAASEMTPGSLTPPPSEASSSAGSLDGGADEDGPEVLLGLGLDQTAVLPAGGVSSFVTGAEDREDSESQRPVYDELPPIDDIFGLAGDDEYGDEADEELAGQHSDDQHSDDQHLDELAAADGPTFDVVVDQPAESASGDGELESRESESDESESDESRDGEAGDDEVSGDEVRDGVSGDGEPEIGQPPGSDPDDRGLPGLVPVPGEVRALETEGLDGPQEAIDDEFRAADQHDAELNGVDRLDVDTAAPGFSFADEADDGSADGHDGEDLDEPSDEADGYDNGDGDQYYDDDENDGYVDDDGQHDQPEADHQEFADFDGANDGSAGLDGPEPGDADAAPTNSPNDGLSATQAVAVDDVAGAAVTQAVPGFNAAPTRNPIEDTVAVGPETTLAEPETPTVTSGDGASRSPLGADLTQTIIGGDDATSIGLDVGYGESPSGEQESDGYETPRRAKWPLVVGGLLLLAMAGVVAFLIGNAGDQVAANPDEETTVISTGPGSLGEPYEVGTGVVVFYDVDGGQNRWVLQVLEPVADLTEDLTAAGVAAPDGNGILAAARVRVTFQSGVATGPVSDLGLDAVVVPSTVFPALADCGPDSLSSKAAVLEADQSIEATLCWAIPPNQLSELILGVTAGPADGTVHMALR